MTDCAICRRHHPTTAGDCGPGCRHVDATIGSVCARCHLRTLDRLDTIAEAAALTAPVSLPSGGAAGGAYGSRPPVAVGWLDWTRGDELRGCLGSWARVVHEDNPDLPWPTTTIPELLTWLRLRWHDVLPAHEAVVEFASEMDVWAGEAMRVLGQTETGQVITCPGCAGRLRVDIAEDPDADIACRRCGATGTAAWMVRLAASQGADGWADAEALGYLGASDRTLRWWARRGKVRSRGTRPVLYSVADVREAMAGIEKGEATA
jgi:hypothetical protein